MHDRHGGYPVAKRWRARWSRVVIVACLLTLALQADRVVVMVGGRLEAQGTPDDPALRAVLEAAFDHAFAIRELSQALPTDSPASEHAPRWIAVPAY